MLLNKLLFSISFLLFLSYNSKAQGIIVGDTVSSGVVYKNIKDSIIGSMSGNSTALADFDLDSDNVMDVRFKIIRSISPGHTAIEQKIFSLNNLEFVLITSPVGYTDTVAINSQINVGLNWGNSTNGLDLYNLWYSGGNTSVYGNFLYPNNYLGFRKISAADTVYGWILVDGTYFSHNRIKVRSWAYQCGNLPLLILTTSSSSICTSESATLTASGANTYSWSTGDTSSDIVVTPNSTTAYTVDGAYTNGCSTSTVMILSVNPTPTLILTSSSNSICASESVTVTAAGADTYTWSTGESNPNIVVSPSVTTTYTVDGYNVYSCFSSSVMTIMVDPCVGIEEYNLNRIKIYPNPASNSLHILDEENTFENSTIEITNYLGQTVLTQAYSHTVDVSILPAGIYTFKINTQGKQSFYSKFIKNS